MKTCLIIAVCGAIVPAAFAQSGNPRATPIDPNNPPVILPPFGDSDPYDLTWNTIDGGGGDLAGSGYVLKGTVGQPDAGLMGGNGYELGGGYWNLAEELPVCYANCDNVGGLTANDFQCFLNAYVSGASYANCDGVGGLTANDFQCFLNSYVAGCS